MRRGRILLVGEENHLPYDRPPLSKKLWFGKKRVEEIFLHDRAFYDQHAVTLALGAQAARLDPLSRYRQTERTWKGRYGPHPYF